MGVEFDTDNIEEVEAKPKEPTEQPTSNENNSGASQSSVDDPEVDSGGYDFAENLMSQQTQQSSAGPDPHQQAKAAAEEDPLSGLSEQEKMEKLLEDEVEQKMTAEELIDVANFGVEVVDTFNSHAAAKYALAKSSEQFELEQNQKRKLAIQGAKMLAKMETKMPPWAVFVLMLILYLAGTWKVAYDVRKANKEMIEEQEKEKRKEVIMKRRAQMKNRVMAHLMGGRYTLKELAGKCGLKEEQLRPALTEMVNDAEVTLDASETPAKYYAA